MKFLITQFVLIFSLLSCNTSKNMDEIATTQIKYYDSWASYKFPFRPVGEISKEEALGRVDVSYYEAVYKGEQLLTFSKFMNGELWWTDKYAYWEDGKTLKKRELVEADGSSQIEHFNRKGKLVSENFDQ